MTRTVHLGRCFFIYIFLMSFCGIRLYAQDKAANYTISLKNETITPSANAAAWLDSFKRAHPETPAQAILQFNHMPSAAELESLKASGILIQSPVTGNAFISLISNNTRISSFSNLRAVVPVKGIWKIDPSVKKWLTQNRTVSVLVSIYPGIDRIAVEKNITSSKGIITKQPRKGSSGYIISITAQNIIALASWYGVQYIGLPADVQPLNFESRNATRANIGTLSQANGGYGLTGEGITVGVGDNVSALYHIDTKERVISFNPSPYTNHGQHTNGTVGGAGIIDPKGEGFAPHVRLLDHMYDEVLYEAAAMSQAYNMTLTNNSYAAIVGSCSNAGNYDVLASDIDNIAAANPEILHVFASGNDGALTCAPYASGYATTVGGYQAGKNVLVVGNMDKRTGLKNTSSRGPMKDGRIKPEICGIGTSVYSTKGVDVYLSADGTSMACPNVTGGAALLSERYKQINSGIGPHSDLLKTLLINGATDYGNPGPDYLFGFGLMNLYRSLQMLDNHRYTTNTIANNGTQTTTVTVPANTAQLKILLYWQDTAASPISATALVNDLDLQVTDPSSGMHLPLVLNPAVTHVSDTAIEGADHLNNVEQVVINNPAAGTYNVTVKGYNIPFGNVPYYIAYDFINTGVSITYPNTASSYPANDSLRIYWDASNDPNPFTLEYSTDNGGTWNQLSNNINAAQRYYTWFTPNISASQCKLRLSRNNTAQQFVTGAFVINPQPVVQLDTAQCPGYMSINWNAVPNATAYEIIRKKGLYMQPIDTVVTTSYVLKGLSTDSFYYVAVRPLINGAPGWRSIAVSRRPNTGNCTSGVSAGDLAAEKIVSPVAGRLFTSTALSNNQSVNVRIRNMGNTAVNSFKLSWNVNNSGWQSQTFNNTIPANSTYIQAIPGFDFSAAGSYGCIIAVQNLSAADPVSINDTTGYTIRQLNNAPMNLATGFTEDFEAGSNGIITRDTMGVLPDEHWDFATTNDTSRLRFFASPEFTISGSRSASMDAPMVIFSGSGNTLSGTFNTAAYDTATTEMRLEFDYRLHGKPKYQNGNEVWIRGNDQQPWIHLLYFDTTQNQGQIIHTSSLSLTSVLAQAHQNFSSSFQVRFGQNDTSAIAASNYGNGTTIDNVKLYTVINDVDLMAIEAPAGTSCNFGTNEPLQVKVFNNYNQKQYSVQLYYQLDGGTTVNETIDSIGAKDTLLYTFTHQLNLSAPGQHLLSVWLSATGDSYHSNDSVLNYSIRNEPLISSFPYLEQFENGQGYWYADGQNSSWAYGTPASQYINKAASGTKAWKTNLAGNYNNNEKSYLYSPCFNISSLTNPMLSFSMAIDMEDCGASICDAAYVEYSINDTTWTRLGATGQGTNWYDAPQLWKTSGFTRWHVASIPLPAVTQTIRLRIALSSDPGTTKEGIAIDDIHIFDKTYDVYNGTGNAAAAQTVSGSQWINFTSGGKLLAQIQPQGQNMGTTSVNLYMHDSTYESNSSQYYLPENFVIQPGTQPADTVLVRYYVTEASAIAITSSTGCQDCSTAPEDIYSLGITRYHDPVAANENGSLNDNQNGMYSFITYNHVNWVPYDNGYYAEAKIPSFSEFWFNDGAPTGQNPLSIATVVFNAQRVSERYVSADWTSDADATANYYELQRSYDGGSFNSIYKVNAQHLQSASYRYTDTPVLTNGSSIYYRVKYMMNNGKVYYTYVRRIDWRGPDQLIQLYPNPVNDGKLHIVWSANTGNDLQLTVTDILGKTIYRNTLKSTAWNNSADIMLSGVANGVYIAHIVIGGNQYKEKLVIH
ncbi:S8 family serine peptidase [Chitinophagaceae bacterium MMS25-I14]